MTELGVWPALGVVALVGAITYSMRASAIVLLADRTLPDGLERALRQVGPAVLAALAINLAAGGDGGPSLQPAEVVALAVAAAVAGWKRNLMWALGAGMAALWLTLAVT